MHNEKVQLAVTACLTTLILFFSGCAVAYKDNRRLLNYMDEKISFESTATKIAASPIFIPVGTLAGISDMIVIHPAFSIPKAINDTYKYIWENPEGSQFKQGMLFFPKIVVTPFYFIGNLTFRSLFPFR